MAQFKLYYNIMNDELGIAQDDWEILCVCRFVPVVRIGARKVFEDGQDPIKFVPHEICEPRTPDWVEIGSF